MLNIGQTGASVISSSAGIVYLRIFGNQPDLTAGLLPIEALKV
jgi:hypothetical protein